MNGGNFFELIVRLQDFSSNGGIFYLGKKGGLAKLLYINLYLVSVLLLA